MTSIFLIDDDIPLRNIYKELLELKGYDVIASASNGKEALEIFKSLPKKPDAIIMDHRMPIMSGLEATQEILKISEDSIIIFASADESVKNSALSMGAMSFKVKPFTYKELISNIDKALNVRIPKIS